MVECYTNVDAVAQLVEALRFKPKVAGSIPHDVTGLIGSAVAQGSTQPLTEISIRSTSWGVKAARAQG
jgi:hypothetical protein